MKVSRGKLRGFICLSGLLLLIVLILLRSSRGEYWNFWNDFCKLNSTLSICKFQIYLLFETRSRIAKSDSFTGLENRKFKNIITIVSKYRADRHKLEWPNKQQNMHIQISRYPAEWKNFNRANGSPQLIPKSSSFVVKRARLFKKFWPIKKLRELPRRARGQWRESHTRVGAFRALVP